MARARPPRATGCWALFPRRVIAQRFLGHSWLELACGRINPRRSWPRWPCGIECSPVGLGRPLWWLSEGDTMGRNYVSFDRKAAQARMRAEQKRRERDRLKTEEAAIWDQLVAEQLEATRSRWARQEQSKAKQRKRWPSATEEGERALKQVIVLLDDYAEIEAKIVTHFIKTFPDSQYVARVLAVSRYQGFVSPPD